MAENESVGRTLGVAAAVALVCSLLVTTAVLWLQPVQRAYQELDRNRAILEAAGMVTARDTLTDRDIVNRFLEFDVRLVDLSRGVFVDSLSPTAYDYRRAIDDPLEYVEIPTDSDSAGLGRRPRRMPVYLLTDGPRLEQLILPVYGPGMWSTIHGFVALGADMVTATGVSFYEHGETPGIGDRIENPDWLVQWAGQRMYGADGSPGLRIGVRPNDADQTAGIDAITGATVTVDAVEAFMLYWLGDDAYGPFLASLRNEAR